MLPGQAAQEEKREVPASEKDTRGKEHAMQASLPPETDKAMARHLQW